MLIYHPAYDAYHCIFRLLFLTTAVKTVEVSKLRILDFFITFPAEVRNIRLSPAHAGKKKLAKKIINIYHGPLSMTQVFRDMEHIQMAAIRALASSKLINQEKLSLGIVERTEMMLPNEMQNRILERNDIEDPVLQFILDELSKIPLLGFDGLKHRTGLMEYRYDNA